MIKKLVPIKDRVVTGNFGGQPIWREKTPEEKLQDYGIDPAIGQLFVRIEDNKTDQK